jgi:hypothetical protein
VAPARRTTGLWTGTSFCGAWYTILSMRAHRSECACDGSVIADQRECVNNVRTKAHDKAGVLDPGPRSGRTTRDERALKGQQFTAKHSHSYSISSVYLRDYRTFRRPGSGSEDDDCSPWQVCRIGTCSSPHSFTRTLVNPAAWLSANSASFLVARRSMRALAFGLQPRSRAYNMLEIDG